ncbi:flagellar basal body rod protein FlgC [Rhodanobacter sp. T12-5]|jgi:flagellar basal-body rod protein FlgC|uniref:flagellar basal body rod protein FlgC n=1 Tax=Rhodanobacter sp. T12-5 TaxID=2024611 RepID=UPI0011ED3B5C|nr:flagellar basal body rod protein FlgC [Rhodanobacter sp. T12-5]KAA0072261.1 flagellar basal body rod protein FlgC [Rhodanobacter sp. T12-5]HTH68847.1 flagellar basal body rod protein FlgC [Rhodanobacter sp.]
MSLFSIFNVAGSGMAAQSVRLNTVASNLANADSVASTPEAAYRSREPLFAAVKSQFDGKDSVGEGVQVLGVTESQAAIPSRYEPGNPLADASGYVYSSNVNPVDELVNMISASRSYQNNVEVMNSTRQLMQKTLDLGK